MTAIVPLLKDFRAQRIGAEELRSRLESLIALCERKRQALQQTRILAADRQEWESYLRPALDLSYQALIGAAQLGMAYADGPSPELAEGIVYALIQVDKATDFVEQRLSGVSADTRAAVAAGLHELNADASAVRSLQSGQAQGSVTLFDD